jgi:hypothetical protein
MLAAPSDREAEPEVEPEAETGTEAGATLDATPDLDMPTAVAEGLLRTFAAGDAAESPPPASLPVLDARDVAGSLAGTPAEPQPEEEGGSDPAESPHHDSAPPHEVPSDVVPSLAGPVPGQDAAESASPDSGPAPEAPLDIAQSPVGTVAAPEPEADVGNAPLSPVLADAAIQVCRPIRSAPAEQPDSMTVSDAPAAEDGHRGDEPADDSDEPRPHDGSEAELHRWRRPSRRAGDSESCDAAICLFEESGIIPDYDDRDAIVRRIHRRGIDAVLSRDYAEADRMHELQARFLRTLAEADRSEAQANRDSQIEVKISAARDELAAARVTWDKRVEHVHELRETKLRELRAAHHQKLKAFEEEYDKIEKFRKYSKPSPALLDLRWRERSMVMCNRFPEAKAMQMRALAIEQAETERAQGIAEMEVMRKRDWLLTRQAQEIEGTMKHYEKFLTQTETQMDRALHRLHRRIDVLLLLKRAPSHGDQGVYCALDPPDPYGLPTPRTRENYHQFRLSYPGRKLPVTPLNNLAMQCPKPIEARAALSPQALRSRLHR